MFDCVYVIYFVNKGSVSVINLWFECGCGGYYVKLCVFNVLIIDNSFDDIKGMKINYMIDLFEGLIGLIVCNIFV